MLKHITAILFLVAFIGQTFNKPFIVVDYYANNAAYQQACINKAKPKMNCKGKCQMMKKLQEEEKKEQEIPHARPDTKTEVFAADNFTFNIETPSVTIHTVYNTKALQQALPLHSGTIFHPPQA
ncbi:MAG: hypothetical protein EOP53_15185 [Sphingobacteriales bacterium]|nr:MAG: hypothetical protein EOP53_15185 [Sphingobacteriales bacterium]